jgi:hypothetical protein
VSDKPSLSQDDLKAPGKAITLKGTVACDVCKGTILINVTDAKGLLTTAADLKPGEFTLLVPKSVGAVNLTAIGDDNSDGMPTAGEALGSYLKNPLTVGDSDVSGVSIQIGRAMAPPAAPKP